jgi:hypothetical protein
LKVIKADGSSKCVHFGVYLHTLLYYLEYEFANRNTNRAGIVYRRSA